MPSEILTVQSEMLYLPRVDIGEQITWAGLLVII